MTVIENLKGFTSSRPPLVMFLVGLGGFMVVLITLAYVVKVQDQLTNPDLTREWNALLDSISDLEFCILGNITEDTYDVPSVSPKLSNQLDGLNNKLNLGGLTTTERTVQNVDEIVNTSLTMLVVMQPTDAFSNILNNVTHMEATITGEQLGLVGSLADLEMNVSLSLPVDWNDTSCNNAKGGRCPSIQILSCINLMAPVSLFPSIRQSGNCYSNKNDTGYEFHTRMLGYPRGQDAFMSKSTKMICKEKPTIHVKNKMDPRFSMMLTLEDRSVINLHLMHTSYFLFVMFITLFCYALIKGKSTKLKTYNHLEMGGHT